MELSCFGRCTRLLWVLQSLRFHKMIPKVCFVHFQVVNHTTLASGIIWSNRRRCYTQLWLSLCWRFRWSSHTWYSEWMMDTRCLCTVVVCNVSNNGEQSASTGVQCCPLSRTWLKTSSQEWDSPKKFFIIIDTSWTTHTTCFSLLL